MYAGVAVQGLLAELMIFVHICSWCGASDGHACMTCAQTSVGQPHDLVLAWIGIARMDQLRAGNCIANPATVMLV